MERDKERVPALPKIYTPVNHIPIAEVARADGVIYLRFKKAGSSAYETMTLDDFLILAAEACY